MRQRGPDRSLRAREPVPGGGRPARPGAAAAARPGPVPGQFACGGAALPVGTPPRRTCASAPTEARNRCGPPPRRRPVFRAGRPDLRETLRVVDMRRAMSESGSPVGPAAPLRFRCSEAADALEPSQPRPVGGRADGGLTGAFPAPGARSAAGPHPNGPVRSLPAELTDSEAGAITSQRRSTAAAAAAAALTRMQNGCASVECRSGPSDVAGSLHCEAPRAELHS